VLRVAGTYVVVAGSLMQAGAVILPAFELPPGAMRLMILSLAAGFPLAVLLAWVLDISPRGIRLAGRPLGRAASEADEVAEGAPDSSVLARSLEMILLGLALPVLGFALVVLVMSWRSGGEEIVRAATGAGRSDGVASLAVLPLADFSSDGGGDAFARGMHEDILTRLARIPSLKLISRTSVMTYAGTQKSVRQIGEDLGVDHVLEGSVRRSDSRVRVTAQLIRTDTDEHVWADQFDADLKDVFEVQSRIAAAIARALERELAPGGAAENARGLAVVPAAYDAYQKARDLHRNLDPGDRATFDEAQRLYEEARRLDPHFSAAWLQLATLHAEARWFGLDRSPERVAQARRCLERARDLASPADRLALAEGVFAYYVDEDLGKALLFFDDAARLAPGDPEASFYRAMILRRRGELARALDAEKLALELDPLNLAYRDEHALTLALAGELASAREELAGILKRDPGRARARVQKWQLDLELDGRPEALFESMMRADRTRWLEPHYTMLGTVAILAGTAEQARGASERATPTPLAHAHHALEMAVLERHAARPEQAAALVREARAAFASSGARGATPLERMELDQLDALIAAEEGRLDDAIAIQLRGVETFPVESDLITGGPALWLLAELQIRAGRLADAAASLERLSGRMALGSVPFGGHFLLHRWPDFADARRDPAFARTLAALRPAYADAWPPDLRSGD